MVDKFRYFYVSKQFESNLVERCNLRVRTFRSWTFCQLYISPPSKEKRKHVHRQKSNKFCGSLLIITKVQVYYFKSMICRSLKFQVCITKARCFICSGTLKLYLHQGGKAFAIFLFNFPSTSILLLL